MSTSGKHVPQVTSSRMTYILAGVAVVAIAIVIAVGVFVHEQRPNPSDDYSVGAFPAQGVNTAPVVIDIYEDFLCPACASFEARSGPNIRQAVLDGKVVVRYHMLDFLNKRSASGDYSTRAAGALLSIAKAGNSQLFTEFHARLFQPGTQPEEDASSDLSNSDLAKIATELGAIAEVVNAIEKGIDTDEAKMLATRSMQRLKSVLGSSVGTPTVLQENMEVDISKQNWLSDVLASPTP
ncbi:MAG: DsbA family protein [Mycobacteriaceae bacterium]